MRIMKMCNVIVSYTVWDKIIALRIYLSEELKMSHEAALKRTDRMNNFLKSLNGIAVYPLCRFRKWRILGYRCVVFERDWVFAYEILEDGIIVQDMSHTAVLAE